MGGGGGTMAQTPIGDLVYRSNGKQDGSGSSDDYTQRYFNRRDIESKKQIASLMDALSRLGVVPQAMQQGFVPNPPYRLPEQEYGF